MIDRKDKIVSKYEREVAQNPRWKPAPDAELRRKLWSRASERTGGRVALCEETGIPLDGRVTVNFSHRNHDLATIGLDFYNSLENVDLVSGVGHGRFHIKAVGRASSIGLTEGQNYYAIEKIWEKLKEFERFQLEDMGYDINRLLPRPEGETAYQKWLRDKEEQEALLAKDQAIKVDEDNGVIYEAVQETKHVSLIDLGVPVPGLPNRNKPHEPVLEIHDPDYEIGRYALELMAAK